MVILTVPEAVLWGRIGPESFALRFGFDERHSCEEWYGGGLVGSDALYMIYINKRLETTNTRHWYLMI